MANLDAISQLADKYHLCPFEFALELSNEADIIICDFNYAFDPRCEAAPLF